MAHILTFGISVALSTVHWGETKTWYGIPGEDAEKFEAAIRREAPDLFETQPDLLFQLVTLMNPTSLREAGVRVYACNQRAGEFVITYPKAYHAGFNHGVRFSSLYSLSCIRVWMRTWMHAIGRRLGGRAGANGRFRLFVCLLDGADSVPNCL